jgi:transmembrane sensor
MMAQHFAPDLLAEAIAWRIRLRHGDSEAWEAFTAWLEQDPIRGDAYDHVADAEDDLAEECLPTVRVAANDDVPAREASPRRWGAVAAGLVAVAAGGIVLFGAGERPSQPVEFATAPGEHRNVTLADGTVVALNGGTRLRVGGAGSRSAELVSGEATFKVRHDSAQPFEVTVAGRVVRDVGTVFNLLTDGDRLSLEVLEGAVVYDPAGAGTRLGVGQILRSDGDNGRLVRGDPAAMASWRSGQLSYDSAPLSAVVSDLSRTSGASVSLDPVLDELPFTGSIRVDGDRAATVRRLAEALGVAAVERRGGWYLEPHRRAPR